MNLLFDQREDSGEKSQEWTQPPLVEPQPPLASEAPAPPPVTHPPLDYYQFEDGENRKRSVWGPLLVILGLLLAIVAAAYYGFFYKSQELSVYTPATQTAGEVAETSGAIESPAATTPVAITESTPAGAMTSIPARQSPPLEYAGSNALATAMQLIANIMTALPADVRLSTLIMDESSFSAEVAADGRSAIENYFATLQARMPGQLSFSPSSGYYSGVRALINGTFADINPPTGTTTTAADLTRMKGELRQMAGDNSFAKPEISYGKAMLRGEVRYVPLFIKVTGTRENFAAYGRAIARRYPELRLSKVIMMLKAEEKVTGVYRLELAGA